MNLERFWAHRQSNPNLAGIYDKVSESVDTSLKRVRKDSTAVAIGSSSQAGPSGQKRRRTGPVESDSSEVLIINLSKLR